MIRFPGGPRAHVARNTRSLAISRPCLEFRLQTAAQGAQRTRRLGRNRVEPELRTIQGFKTRNWFRRMLSSIRYEEWRSENLAEGNCAPQAPPNLAGGPRCSGDGASACWQWWPASFPLARAFRNSRGRGEVGRSPRSKWREARQGGLLRGSPSCFTAPAPCVRFSQSAPAPNSGRASAASNRCNTCSRPSTSSR